MISGRPLSGGALQGGIDMLFKNGLVFMENGAFEKADVRVKDGKIADDSQPYTVDDSAAEAPVHKNMGRSTMSFITSLSLSFNNLRTKKGRTFMNWIFRYGCRLCGACLLSTFLTIR